MDDFHKTTKGKNPKSNTNLPKPTAPQQSPTANCQTEERPATPAPNPLQHGFAPLASSSALSSPHGGVYGSDGDARSLSTVSDFEPQPPSPQTPTAQLQLTPGQLNPGLYPPTLPPMHPTAAVQPDDMQTIANRFRNPPDSMYNADRTHVTLIANWAIGIIGTEEVWNDFYSGGRRLTVESRIRAEGLAAGIPQPVMQWLVGYPLEEVKEFSAEIFGGAYDGDAFQQYIPDNSQQASQNLQNVPARSQHVSDNSQDFNAPDATAFLLAPNTQQEHHTGSQFVPPPAQYPDVSPQYRHMSNQYDQLQNRQSYEQNQYTYPPPQHQQMPFFDPPQAFRKPFMQQPLHYPPQPLYHPQYPIYNPLPSVPYAAQPQSSALFPTQYSQPPPAQPHPYPNYPSFYHPSQGAQNLLPPEPSDTQIRDIVSFLMRPPNQPSPCIHGFVISVAWALEIIGPAYLYRPKNSRAEESYLPRLDRDSWFSRRALRLGLPRKYWRALCGGTGGGSLQIGGSPDEVIIPIKDWRKGLKSRAEGNVLWDDRECNYQYPERCVRVLRK
ncbi:hypothetical protein K458DRAFT_403807 [Lentithecium fluviatile CBS 122367]|uniref:Uncharacterized protein n=1 Tax=Lentithecium fluviatile CBS 122367 TaxID=1168545 RepID=A0A6G1J2W0_9PLEO|nr:hypothetical protein K458DRAFT_403807 [Lentithecium fluviatile CBS 122367]